MIHLKKWSAHKAISRVKTVYRYLVGSKPRPRLVFHWMMPVLREMWMYIAVGELNAQPYLGDAYTDGTWTLIG